MPLVVLTGIPCSGKTTTAKRLKLFLESRKMCKVEIISESDYFPKGENKNSVAADFIKEKQVRGALRSAAIRCLSKNTIVILDGGNYIKGFRYEVWCASKSYKCTQCTVHCDVSPQNAWAWNEGRQDEKYDKETFDALVMRYEAPNSHNRWDSPLLLALVSVSDDSSNEEDRLGGNVHDALFNRAPPPPNLSTQNQSLAPTDFLHKVDRATSGVLEALLESQRNAVEGDMLGVPGTEERIFWTKRVSRAEVNRSRKQFLVYLKARGVDDLTKVNSLFVQYLNSSLFNNSD